MLARPGVFINCPLDDEYWSLFRPLTFTVAFSGFRPVVSPQRSDTSEVRLTKIIEFIKTCRYCIHDLSRFRSTVSGEYYRLNMPFELGLDFGHKYYTKQGRQSKQILVLESEKYSSQKSLSDLAGCDMKCHNDSPIDLVKAVREWLFEIAGSNRIIGPSDIWNRFNDFTYEFHLDCKSNGFSESDLEQISINEYLHFLSS